MTTPPPSRPQDMPAQAPSLTLKRRLNAPADKIFAAWTSGAMLKRWFGPSDAMVVTIAEVDLRVGGRYRIVMQEPSGEQHRVAGIYRQIERNALLVFTWAWESAPEKVSLVTVRLEPDGSATQLTLTHEQFADEPARDLHTGGWNGTLDRLERALAQPDSST